MASSERWICDGIPKNEKYSGLGFPHPPYENYGNVCIECGLPRDSVISDSADTPIVPIPQPIPESKPMPMKDSNIIEGKRVVGKSQFTDKTPKHFMNQKLIKKLLWLPSKVCTFIKTVKNIM